MKRTSIQTLFGNAGAFPGDLRLQVSECLQVSQCLQVSHSLLVNRPRPVGFSASTEKAMHAP